MDYKVLVVDDEAAILDSLCPFLNRAGYIVDTARDGVLAKHKYRHFKPDVIVLDVVMPRIDGRQFLRELRENNNWTPVILLTAVGDATERAMAITEGADDYINKPYDPHELIARIGSVLRRAERGEATLASADLLKAGSIAFDRKSRVATVDDERIRLTPKAMHLLEFMMLHPGDLLSRERLFNAVWGWNTVAQTSVVETRSLDQRIRELRKALGEDKKHPKFIETVPGEGYRFIAKTRS